MFRLSPQGYALAAFTLLLVLLGGGAARAADPVARAVLFFSPACPHCHIVLEEVLPPLQARYGTQLAVQTIDVTQPAGEELYNATVAAFAIPAERLGVPMLVFGDTVLVGSEEIPAQLPSLIAAALAAGGNAWPAIPGFVAPVGALPLEPPALSPFQRDPVANSLALLLLVGMALSVVVVVVTVRAPFDRQLAGWREWAVPLLAFVGIIIATYLAVVEVRGTTAVCGPVGDCNTVQQSPYARLFGVLPVGLLGILGYTLMLGAWAVRQFGPPQPAHWAGLALPVIALIGTLFSIYLTFLEPFVIGASCLWCLSSAALMTALLWVTAPRGAVPIRRGRPRRRAAH